MKPGLKTHAGNSREIRRIKENGVIIPPEKLSGDALGGLVEEFVSRDGTDTGYENKSLPNDVKAVKRQLRQGEAFIVYDQNTGTCNIVHRDDLNASE